MSDGEGEREKGRERGESRRESKRQNSDWTIEIEGFKEEMENGKD